MVNYMKELKGTLKTMYILIFVWLLTILFSAVMFTISLMYEEYIVTAISCVTGVFSSTGIFYTGYLAMRIENRIKNIENKENI